MAKVDEKNAMNSTMFFSNQFAIKNRYVNWQKNLSASFEDMAIFDYLLNKILPPY